LLFFFKKNLPGALNAELEALGDPDCHYQNIQGAASEKEEEEAVARAEAHITHAKKIAMRAFNISKQDLEASLRERGLEDDASKVYSRDLPSALPGGAVEEDAFLLNSLSSSDSSAPERDDKEALVRTYLNQVEESFRMYQRFYERLPENFKQAEDTTIYNQIPEAMNAVQAERRAYFSDEE
jgi:hypothetical protein